jgi:MFS family permease
MSAPALKVPHEESSASYEGWRIVLAASVGGMVCFSSLIVYTFGIFLKPLSAEFGWSREEVSRAFGLMAMTIALCSPFIGRLLDRLEPRRVIVPCFAVLGLAFASLSLLTPHLWHFYVVFFVIGVVGNATTQMGYSRAITSWFTRHRGLALAFVLAGLGVGSIIMPVLAQYLIDNYGWRSAYAVLGIATLLIGIPLTLQFVRNRDDAQRTLLAPSTGISTGIALRTRAFWLLVITLFLTSVSANGAITQLSAILTDRGVSAAQAALTAAVLGGASLLGRLVTGWFLDRYFGPSVSGVLLVLMTAGMVLLGLSTTPAISFLAAALIGIGLGGEADVTPFLLARYYGLRNFSSLYGLTWMFYAVGGALGPVVLARVFDSTGSYARVLVLMPIPILVSALLMIAMPRYPEAE